MYDFYWQIMVSSENFEKSAEYGWFLAKMAEFCAGWTVEDRNLVSPRMYLQCMTFIDK